VLRRHRDTIAQVLADPPTRGRPASARRIRSRQKESSRAARPDDSLATEAITPKPRATSLLCANEIARQWALRRLLLFSWRPPAPYRLSDDKLVPASAATRPDRSLTANLGAMTVSELAERIEARLAGLEQEMSRLQAAEQVLAATRPQAVAAEPAPQPRSPEPAQQPSARDRASRRRAPDNAAARRASTPAPVLALSRELDAGLRNRP